jgi:ATP-dependent RNA helicase DeaD
LRVLVLDEADEMLNMGFQEDIDTILSKSPADRQSCLFSATMPPEVRRIAQRYMRNPAEISLAANTTNENIEHHYYVVKEKNRYEAVKRILDVEPDVYGILFAQTRIWLKSLFTTGTTPIHFTVI